MAPPNALSSKNRVTRMQLSKNSCGAAPAGWFHAVQRAVAQRAANTPNGADRNRTDDLRLARAALSHLSYSPVTAAKRSRSAPLRIPHLPTSVVGLGRVELPTSPLSGVRSSQLSYRPGQRSGPSKLGGNTITMIEQKRRRTPLPNQDRAGPLMNARSDRAY